MAGLPPPQSERKVANIRSYAQRLFLLLPTSLAARVALHDLRSKNPTLETGAYGNPPSNVALLPILCIFTKSLCFVSIVSACYVL